MPSAGALWVVDRIEEGRKAVLIPEVGKPRVVDLDELPTDAREGSALREVAEAARGGAVERYRLDPQATERLRKDADVLRSRLRRGPSGPVSL